MVESGVEGVAELLGSPLPLPLPLWLAPCTPRCWYLTLRPLLLPLLPRTGETDLSDVTGETGLSEVASGERELGVSKSEVGDTGLESQKQEMCHVTLKTQHIEAIFSSMHEKTGA